MSLFDAAALVLALVGMGGGAAMLALAHAGHFPTPTLPRKPYHFRKMERPDLRPTHTTPILNSAHFVCALRRRRRRASRKDLDTSAL